MKGRLPKCFSSGGKQTTHKISAASIVKNCHPPTSSNYPFAGQHRLSISMTCRDPSSLALSFICIGIITTFFVKKMQYNERNHEFSGAFMHVNPKYGVFGDSLPEVDTLAMKPFNSQTKISTTAK